MIGVNLVGYTKRKLGIGEAFMLNIEAFKTTNIPFRIYDVETSECVVGNDIQTEYSINLFQISPQSILIIHKNFKEDFYEKKYNILFAAWESEYVPHDVRDNVSFFDEIWCPSKFCQSILSRYFQGSVINIPHPVQINTDDLKNTESLIYNKSKISFLTIFDYNSSIERKNILGLLESFQKAFGTTNDNTELIIKATNSKRNKEAKRQIEKKLSEMNYVKVIDCYMSRVDLNQLIYDCDSYISLHRSEGFGLTIAEAMFLQKPVIATGYSGNMEYMNCFNSFLVDFEIIKNKKSDSNYDENIVWAQPSKECASIHLRNLALNYESLKEIGLKASLDIKDKFSFNEIGSLIFQRIMSLDRFSFVEKNTKNEIFRLKSDLRQKNKELKKIKNFFLLKFFFYFK